VGKANLRPEAGGTDIKWRSSFANPPLICQCCLSFALSAGRAQDGERLLRPEKELITCRSQKSILNQKQKGESYGII
jgi:hypothetical protein